MASPSARRCATAVYAVLLASASLAAQVEPAARADSPPPAATAPPAPPPNVLELVSGERIAGRLDLSSPRPGLAWVTPVFATPLEFPATAIAMATFAADPATYEAKGTWRVALANGDVVFGDLTALDASTLTLATARHGALAIARSAVVALQRRVGGGLVYQGPNSVLEWTSRAGAPPDAWRAVAGSLVAASAGAELFRDGVLAQDGRLVCELSWTGNPAFRLVLGATADANGDAGAVVVEAWDDLLVARRERPDGVDLLPLPVVVRERGNATLHCRRQADVLTFVDAAGAEIGRLPFAGAGTGVALRQIYAGELRLDRLRVERIYGAGETAPRTLTGADVRSYDAAQHRFDLGGTAVDDAGIAAVRFADQATTASGPAASAASGAELLLQDGSRIAGEFAGIADGRLAMRVGWAAAPVATTVDALQALRVSGNPRPRQQEQCQLAIGADRFLGRIVGWSATAGTLLWQPTLANAPSVLQSKTDLRFDLAKSSAYFASTKNYPHRLLFTNRDSFAAKVVAITPATITYLEPFRGTQCEVPSSAVKAIEFDPRAVRRIADDARTEVKEMDAAARRAAQREGKKQRDRNFVDAGRRETILALPRKYKGRPPTHLVLAANGDVLRGVLANVTDDAVEFEMSLSSNASVPRATVAAMVLFHEPKVEQPEIAKDAANELVLELALDAETRVTLTVTGADAKGLTGRSPLCGEVTIPWEDVTAMVSGALRGQAAGFFTAWQQAPMKEPPY